MSFSVLTWTFVVAVTIHNLEEALYLPKWSRAARRFHHPVGTTEFRFAVIVLTALAAVCAIAASGGSVGASISCAAMRWRWA